MDDPRTRVIRRRIEDLQGRLARRGRPRTEDRPLYFGQVYDGGSFPTSLAADGTFFLTRPARFGGTETAGNAGTITADSSRSRTVLVIGDRLPVAGDGLIARLINGRWVAESRTVSGAGTIRVGCCSNLVPDVLTLTSDDYGDVEMTWDPTLRSHFITDGTPFNHPAGGWFGQQMIVTSESGISTGAAWGLFCGVDIFGREGWLLVWGYTVGPNGIGFRPGAPPLTVAEFFLGSGLDWPVDIGSSTCGPPIDLLFVTNNLNLTGHNMNVRIHT